MIKLTEEEICIEGCVYKIHCWEKYIIVKAQTLFGSITSLNRDYDNFVRLQHKDFSGRHSFYIRFFTYRYNNPSLKVWIELILETKNAYQLLKREETELSEAITDVNCLNNNVHAYIPQKRTDGMYGWIKPTWVLNFKRFTKTQSR